MALEPYARVVLAVSGGADSMVLLDAAAAVARARVAAVATFDHGTGPHAARAARLVARTARRLGLDVVRERAKTTSARANEAGWRASRWRFLSGVASARSATVATAHTLDDQVETVALRILRSAGARGLAALAADSLIARPLLGVSRAQVEAYARARRLEVVDDPSNASRAHLRNRVRLDLLPALERARPGTRAELLVIGARAAEWRRAMGALAAEVHAVRHPDRELRVASTDLLGYDAAALRALWPALAARGGVTLDRRGTWRVAQFTIESVPGGTMQLSGGFEVARTRDWFVLRPSAAREPGAGTARALAGDVTFGTWRFRPAPAVRNDLWHALLPADSPLLVRRWGAGDRMRAAGRTTARRVKRYLSDAHLSGAERAEWPVVLAGEEIVWIPGVCRSDAATVRPGRPGQPYACHRDDID